MKETVDQKLRIKARFRCNRPCAYQIASLCIINEQSMEWKSLLYINFICNTYQGMTCRVAHAGQMSRAFRSRQEFNKDVCCPYSPFLLVIYWIMRTTTSGRNNGTLVMQLNDLYFAYNLVLLWHNQSQMQDKTTCLATTSAGT